MKKLIINLTSDEHRDLKIRAATEGTTMAGIIRAALGLSPTFRKDAT